MTLTYTPMSLFKWQMYAAQTMRNKWYNNFFGEDMMGEESDDEQDALKVDIIVQKSHYPPASHLMLSTSKNVLFPGHNHLLD